jgi:GPH family glycoside/pentoside/hexuronide:cation symporter
MPAGLLLLRFGPWVVVGARRCFMVVAMSVVDSPAGPKTLPGSKAALYALGQLGTSIAMNIVAVALVFFYLPPDSAGLPELITTSTFLGVLNALVLVAASGRLLDAVTDPLVANLSDRSTNPDGRRIPFMKRAAIPVAVFLLLMFVPPSTTESGWNIVWLVVVQAAFYVSLTFYLTPYYALTPDMGHTPTERLNLATYTSVTFALGIVVAGTTPLIASILEDAAGWSPLRSFQVAVAILAAVAMVLMLVPALTIHEPTYSAGEPSSTPVFQALKMSFAIPDFRRLVFADFTYFTGLTIAQTGLLYYVTVLLEREEELVASLLAVLVLASLLFFPIVNLLARRVGKKPLILASLVGMGVVFFGVVWLGRLGIDATAQAYLLILALAVPVAFLSVLPFATLCDIAEYDAARSGEAREGMFVAARTFMQKGGQTSGVLIFAVLTTFGRDVGDDLGIRLSGIAGCLLCISAAALFTGYRAGVIEAEVDETELVTAS